MKKIINFFLATLLLFMTSCGKKQAIKLCQETKAQYENGDILSQWALRLAFGLSGLPQEATWNDVANLYAANDANNHYDWKANKLQDASMFLVHFVDTAGWGLRWEVNTKEKTVVLVNGNEYLSRKHGLSRFNPNNEFSITNIDINKIERDNDGRITYTLKACVRNNTGKTITHARLTGTMKVIYKDKTIDATSSWDDGFVNDITMRTPWKNNTEQRFYVKTTGIDPVYLDYAPEYVLFNLNLNANDPVGWEFNQDIVEYDLLDTWKKL